MPHLIIEYASPLKEELNIQGLVQDVFEAADASGLFSTNAIKARAVPVDHYVIGGKYTPYVHVNIKLLPGRTAEMKKNLSVSVFDAIKKQAKSNVSVSVEVNNLDGDSYTK